MGGAANTGAVSARRRERAAAIQRVPEHVRAGGAAGSATVGDAGAVDACVGDADVGPHVLQSPT
jgi:hypothetical protein